MKYEIILDQIKAFVRSFLKNNENSKLSYHSPSHTENVVVAVIQIANHYQLSDEDFFIVTAAAWFHDTGYLVDPDNHEDKSIEIALNFFTNHKINETVKNKISGCIAATKVPQKPLNLLEEILCDADLFHLGTDEFNKNSKQLHKEVEALSGTDIDKATWRAKNISLLEQHRYHTDYCRLLLDDQKAKNLEKLINKQAAFQKEILVLAAVPPVLSLPAAQGVKRKKGEKRSKGVETMFRITASNQQRLSNMADSKAHIMISVNSIIISLLLSLLLRKIDEHPHQVIPAIMLLVVNLITIVFSILATRPNITLGTFTRDDVAHREVNLLFFGNFFKMTFDKYKEGMLDMMDDNDFLYGSLIRDLYAQGVVLGRKYHLLRLSYNVFMYGLIVSVIAFVISTILT